jgi:hypothetical protein
MSDSLYIKETVYILCTLTSLVVAALLLRGYRRSSVRLLLWSGLCFIFLTLNNLLLFVDKVLIGPERDLAVWRSAAAATGLVLLVYGLICDSE